MKLNKKIIAISAAVLMVAATSVTAYASSAYNTPAEAVAGLTERTVGSVVEERTQSGNNYGEIANEAGVLDSFQSEMIEMKKDILAEKVASGDMTQERADEIITAIEQQQENCDGTGGGSIGKKFGAGFGSTKGEGNGFGSGMRGQGRGSMGLRDGSCATN